MSELVQNGAQHAQVRSLPMRGGVDRRLSRSLSVLERATVLKVASVQASAIVQTEKMHEVDRLARSAMAGQAMLAQWASTLAHGDPFIADELKFFTDVARIGKAEIIADTVASYGRTVG